MNLKTRLWAQSLTVLLCTTLLTVCSGFLYVYFYDVMKSAPGNGLPDTAVVVFKDGSAVYKSEAFSVTDTKEMLMNISMNKYRFEFNNVRYNLLLDTFEAQNEKYDIIRLTPVINIGDFYLSLIIFIVAVFLLTFLIASFITQRRNARYIINPIVKLKSQTEDLKEGNLTRGINTEGIGELGELSEAVEQLRLKLLNSVYYKEKVDENRKFLISSISHDLRTPVTSIRGYIDGILDGVADTEPKKSEYLKKALDKTNLLNTMIEDLLLYSRLDLNQMPFDLKKIDILSYMEDCVSDNAVLFDKEDKKISLVNELSGSAFLTIDPEQFKRVVQNIVDNARKNIESGSGLLSITLREAHSSVILEFRDNGKGIKEEDLPHVFERFYRADPARSPNGSSGLGLAIAKQIVEGMGGRIWAISQNGASILISLKRAVENEKNSNN